MNIYDFTHEELETFLIENGFKKFNATQILEWMYEKNVFEYDKMTNLSKKLISFLNEKISIELPKVVQVEKSKLANKYLLELKDNNKIECVLMNHDYGYSLCVSSQVGCNMGCSFCESGRLKKVRDLTLAELVGQVICVSKYEQVRIDSIVVMGIGEPFDNFENIKRFIKVVTDPKMINIGQRHLTISTCGLVPKIYEFADLETGVNLAISLHAPNNELRSRIMPINRKFPLEDVVAAARHYAELTKRRVTYEYILIDGLNDGEPQAKELVKLLHGQLASVNLIPINPVRERNLLRPSRVRIESFEHYLAAHKVAVTVRREMGADIQAACGQLRNRHLEQEMQK